MPKATQTNTTEPPLTSGIMAFAIAGTIDRLKQIAAEAMDHLYLSDGPPQPDYELLDICAELLHLQKKRGVVNVKRREATMRSPAYEALRAEVSVLDGKISSLLCLARKRQATTAAGVYAKALVMRSAGSGAPQLALSLANDLIATPALRASIWPNEGVGVQRVP